MTIEVKGLKELDIALGLLGSKTLAKGVLRRIGLKALEPFVEDVQRLAPIDEDPAITPKRAPGTLRRSYHAGTQLNKNQAKMARREGKSFTEVYAGTNDPVGVLVEFGTGERVSKKTGKSSGSMPPQPHARPAWAGAQSQVIETIAKDMMEEIDKTADRAAVRALRGK